MQKKTNNQDERARNIYKETNTPSVRTLAKLQIPNEDAVDRKTVRARKTLNGFPNSKMKAKQKLHFKRSVDEASFMQNSLIH